MKASASLARAGLLFLCLSTSAFAAPDGGWDVEFYDAGTVLTTRMACEPPSDAQSIDLALRTAESERDQYRTALAITLPVAGAVIIALVVGLFAKK